MSSYNKKASILQELEHAIKRKITDKSRAKQQTSKILQASVEKRTQLATTKPASRDNRVISSFKTKQNKQVLQQTLHANQGVSLFSQQPSQSVDLKQLGKKTGSRKWQKLVSLINYMLSSSDKAIKYISASNFEAQFAVKLFKSDRENLISEIKALDLEELAGEVLKNSHSSKEAIGKETYNQMAEENIKLKKEIMLLEKEMERFRLGSGSLMTEVGHQNHLNSTNLHNTTSKLSVALSTRQLEAVDYEELVKQSILQEKGHKRLEEVMLKEKKFQIMLGKCKQNDKKIDEINQILSALNKEKLQIISSCLRQTISQHLQPKSTRPSQQKLTEIHKQKSLLQQEIINLKQNLVEVRNIQKLEEQNNLMKKNHEMLYQGLSQILRKVDGKEFDVREDQIEENDSNNRVNVIHKIQAYIQSMERQLSQVTSQKMELQQQLCQIQQEHDQQISQLSYQHQTQLSELQTQKASTFSQLVSYRQKTQHNLNQYKTQIQRLNNAILFLEQTPSQNLSQEQEMSNILKQHQGKVQQLERLLAKTEEQFQREKQARIYEEKRVLDLEEQLYQKERKDNLQEIQQIKQKYEAQLKRKQIQLEQVLNQVQQLSSKLKLNETYIIGLKSQISENQAKLSLYQKEMEKLAEQVQDYEQKQEQWHENNQTTNKAHHQSIKKMNEQISDYCIENMRLKDLVERMEQDIEQLTNREKDLDSVKENYEQEISQSRKRLSETQSQLTQLRKQLYDVTMERDRIEQAMQRQKSQFERNIQKERNELSRQIQRLVDENNQLTIVCNDLSGKNSTLTNINNTLSQQNKGLSQQKANLTNKLKEIQLQRQELISNVQKLTQQTNELTDDNSQMHEWLNQTRSLSESLKTQMSQMKEQKQALSEELEQALRICDTLKEEVNKAMAENDRIKQQNQQIRQELQSIKKKEDRENLSYEQSQSVITKLQSDIQNLSTANQQLTINNQQTSIQIQQLLKKNENLSTVNQQLSQKNQQLKSQNQVLLNKKNQLNAKNQEFSIKIQQLSLGIQQISAKNQQLSMQRQYLSKEHKQLIQQKQSLQMQVQSSKALLQQQQQQKQDLCQQVSKATQLQASLRQQLSQLKQDQQEQPATLLPQVTTSKQLCLQLQLQNRQLQQQLNSSLQLLEQMKDQLKRQQHKIQQLNMINHQLKLSLQAKSLEHQLYVKQNSIKIKEIQDKIETLQKQIGQKDRIIGQIQSESFQIKQSHEHDKQIIKQLQNQLHTIKQNYQQALSQQSNLSVALRQQNQQLNEQILKIGHQLNRTISSNSQLQKKLTQLNKALQQINLHNIQVREQLQTTIQQKQLLQKQLQQAKKKQQTTSSNDTLNKQLQQLKKQLTQVSHELLQIKQQRAKQVNIQQLKSQQYVILLKKILQSTNIEFEDLKEEMSLDALLEKGSQRIMKMKRQLRDQQSNRKKLWAREDHYSVNREYLQGQSISQTVEPNDFIANQTGQVKQFMTHDSHDKQQQWTQLPRTKLFQLQPQGQQNKVDQSIPPSIETQINQQGKQHSNSKSESQHNNMSDFGQIEENDMTKSQMSIEDHQERDAQVQQDPDAMNKQLNQQGNNVLQKKQQEFHVIQREMPNQTQQDSANEENDIEEFNDVKSEQMNASFVSQDGNFDEKEEEHSHKLLQSPKNQQEQQSISQQLHLEQQRTQAQTHQQQFVKQTQAHDQQQSFSAFNNYVQGNQLNSSVISQSQADNIDQFPQQEEHRSIQNSFVSSQGQHSPKNKQVQPSLKQKMSSSPQITEPENLFGRNEQMLLSAIKKPQTNQQNQDQNMLDELDGFGDYESQKMSESFVSDQDHTEHHTQNHPIDKSKLKQQQDNDFGDFDDYKSEKMNDSIISESDL